jgi:hypothetical protein
MRGEGGGRESGGGGYSRGGVGSEGGQRAPRGPTGGAPAPSRQPPPMDNFEDDEIPF